MRITNSWSHASLGPQKKSARSRWTLQYADHPIRCPARPSVGGSRLSGGLLCGHGSVDTPDEEAIVGAQVHPAGHEDNVADPSCSDGIVEPFELLRLAGQSVEVVTDDGVNVPTFDVGQHALVLRPVLARVGRDVVVDVFHAQRPAVRQDGAPTVLQLALHTLPVTFDVEGDAGVDGWCGGGRHRGVRLRMREVGELGGAALGERGDVVDLQAVGDATPGHHATPVPVGECGPQVPVDGPTEVRDRTDVTAWWKTKRRNESSAMSRAMATGMGPWLSISQVSPGSAVPLRSASRSTRTMTEHVGGRSITSSDGGDPVIRGPGLCGRRPVAGVARGRSVRPPPSSSGPEICPVGGPGSTSSPWSVPPVRRLRSEGPPVSNR